MQIDLKLLSKILEDNSDQTCFLFSNEGFSYTLLLGENLKVHSNWKESSIKDFPAKRDHYIGIIGDAKVPNKDKWTNTYWDRNSFEFKVTWISLDKA